MFSPHLVAVNHMNFVYKVVYFCKGKKPCIISIIQKRVIGVFMSYIVLARKYRPATFREIYSQDHITQILSNAIKSNRIAHAYLFTGPRGVGKTSMARILAKSLNCVKGPTDSPCGECHNCLEITATTSPDVNEIDGASNTSVDDVRDLQQELVYVPIHSKYKIYIIDEVHMLSKSAFNALLKTLEEPPENVVFIFATTEPQKVLATIISRCQRFDFRRIPVDDISKRLQEIAGYENIDIDDESIYLIARKSDGGMRDALSLLDQVLSFAEGPIRISQVREVFGELSLTVFANIMLSVYNHDTAGMIQIFHTAINQGIDLFEFLNGFLEFLRQVVLQKTGIPLKGLVREDQQVIAELSDASNINNLMYMMTMLIQLKQDTKTSSHPSILAEAILIKMTKMEEMEDLEKILSRLEKMPSLSTVAAPSNDTIADETKAKKVELSKPVIPEAIELDYVPPTKVKELTKDHVLENWDSFINMIKPDNKIIALYLKKECISSVKSDVIFMDFDMGVQFKMVNNAKEYLNNQLSKFFDLPVKLILRLVDPPKANPVKTPTLQEIQKENPTLAKLIEMTDSMIIPQ
jgi:DNA polymerase-3 subunit gamma/tau